MQESAEILIVDDIPEHIAFAGNLLRSEGYRVYAVTNGTAALHFLETKHPDLIMLDIKMNGMDGLTVCRHIKENPDTSDIPVIFLTAETKTEAIKQGFTLGGCDYVVKPFLREEFLARVKTHLNISRQSHALSIANQELKQFCSAVSHDLKSPLNVINMLIAALSNELGENQSDDVSQIMDMICKKSNQLIVMIDRLLEFSKMCNITPEMEPLELSSIIKEICNELKSLEPDRCITLNCETLPTVMGDEVLVNMLLKNVLSNAVKFTRHREEAIITVRALPDAVYHVISIQDNGVGFDMAYADKLFQVFQRLHEDNEFEGSGIGLALVYRIMKRHGGKVEAIGKVDHGAEIKLYFPKSKNES
ncbi:MAG: response regulator [Ruminococcus sp.]